MPVISDTAFAAVPSSSKEPMLWTLEMPPHQLRVARHPPEEVAVEHLEWVRDTFLDGALLLENEAFNRAFQTFDNAIWAHSASSAIIMAWAALETLFRPGRRQITKTLAICIATFLHPGGPDRDRAYQEIERVLAGRISIGTTSEDGKEVVLNVLGRRSLRGDRVPRRQGAHRRRHRHGGEPPAGPRTRDTEP